MDKTIEKAYSTKRINGFYVFLFVLLLLCCLLFSFFALQGGNLLFSYLTISWLVIFSLATWFGNSQISKWLDKKLPWEKFIGIRLLTQLVLSIFYAVFCFNITFLILRAFFTNQAPRPEQLAVMNIYGILFVIPIFFLYFSIHFLRAWRQSALEGERLQKENVRSQMMALKNHLDPHFLFNNLNILSSLMDKDIDLSQEYLNKFAEVYRIILRTEFTDLISVEEELRFVEAYMFLINIRFGENIHFESNVSVNDKEKAIPPLGIQMLIENAIKHNTISKNSPLNISITSEANDYLKIENTLQIKSIEEGKSSKSGLQNIKNRYQYFTDKPVIIEQNQNNFYVKIPLLEIEEW